MVDLALVCGNGQIILRWTHAYGSDLLLLSLTLLKARVLRNLQIKEIQLRI